MSKTVGNTVDPFPLIEKYGSEVVRYFLYVKYRQAMMAIFHIKI